MELARGLPVQRLNVMVLGVHPLKWACCPSAVATNCGRGQLRPVSSSYAPFRHRDPASKAAAQRRVAHFQRLRPRCRRCSSAAYQRHGEIEFRFVLVQRADFEIIDDWFVTVRRTAAPRSCR